MDSKSLIKRRASYKAKLTQFKSYLESLLSCCQSLSSVQINELNIRLSKLDSLYSEYDAVQIDIENLSEVPDDQYKERETFEAQYYGTIATARDALDRHAAAACNADKSACSSVSVSGSGTAVAGRPTFKLPVIHLPSFSGRYQEWLEFHDTYTSLIHDNHSIPNINKFHYLRAALKDSAASIIQSLDFSADNYKVAWELLCERFHNSRLLINNHIQSIFNIEPITKESAKALRHVIDTINRNLRALKTLKLPTEHWDVLIIHIVSNKLDNVTCREWEVHRSKSGGIPTLKEFNDYLKGRADLLETVDEQSKNKRRHSDSSVIRNKAFIENISQSGTQQGTTRSACPICKHNHAIFRCYKFKAMSVQNRIERIKALQLCQNCLRSHSDRECISGPCTICSEKHNSLLHQKEKVESKESQASSVVLSASHTVNESNQSDITTKNISLSSTSNNLVLLSTAIINVSNQDTKHTQSVRVLLDNGSTTSFISETLSKKLNLKTFSTRTSVEGLNHQISQITKRCDITISSCYDKTYSADISCFVVPHITQSLPVTQIDCIRLNIPSHIQLADPTFDTPSQVDMLLGADIFWDILGSKRITLGKTKPILSETRLGWLVSGVIHSQYTSCNTYTVHCHHISDTRLEDQLTKFFELESVTPISNNMSKEQYQCEQLFTQTTTRQADGRFVVTIPLRQSSNDLGDSLEQATSRFLSLERKFKKNPGFKKLYCEFIQEYIDLKHMSENTSIHQSTHQSTHNTIQNYLPHHGVLRETSLTTKLRVVFDASAVTTSGLSFNDIQLVGPIVQNDLISILTRFRQHKYVVTADCEKMFRMVAIDKSQHNLQQILWRFDPTQEIKSYHLLTATYGTASAPWLTTRCIVELGKLSDDPAVSKALINDFYVDDYISGHSNASELIRICKGVINQLESAQFHLRKWHSNNSDILEKLHGKSNTDLLLNLSKDEQSKTLGLIWACQEDCFVYSVKNIELPKIITKRTVLSVISQIFDPLGLINPSILLAKLILQKLWASKISWDEPFPADIEKQWSNFIISLPYLNHIKIPRYVICDEPIRVELHAFSDASIRAYSACVYFRSITADNKVTVRLVMAKSRVAPIKPMTMPRLELCGALLATRLAKKVRESVRLSIESSTYWCDSTIVLGWIKSSNTHLLKMFVMNRINEIVESTDPKSWRYVPTSMNPADIGSRGLEPLKLQDSSLWWHGPSYLLESECQWPQPPTQTNEIELPEFKNICHVTSNKTSLRSESQSDNLYLHRYSDINRLQRVTAYILRFIHNCRKPQNKFTADLNITELNSSMHLLCKLSQLESFPDEYHILSNNGQLKIKNQLVKFNPFYQETSSLIRVGGRLSNSNYDYDTKHPILLHASHTLTQLIFKHYHTSLMHAGPQLLLASIRHKYWPIGGRNLARKTVHNCLTCIRFSGRSIQPIMGNLPRERVQGEFPFVNTAVDYAGPILIANRKGRGSKHIKAYICVFVCLTVKAVHIELVTELTKECFLAALNRFIARRGRPACLFSDNGTNFVGACNDLAKFLKQCNQEISSYVAQNSITFKFSPAYSPHFNSLAESAVKSIKYHLKRVLSMAFLTYEEMNTLLVQIEAILNSRPITPLSSDPSDLIPLTPSHFLIGRTLTLIPSPQVQAHSLQSMPRYQRVQQLKAHFWNRFYREYISELQKRVKWHRGNAELREGDMMIVKDDRLPPNRWLIGRITNLHRGNDGVARIADLKTSTGNIRRAFNRLVPIPNLELGVPKPGPC